MKSKTRKEVKSRKRLRASDPNYISINQSINQSVSQSISQSVSQSINQSINHRLMKHFRADKTQRWLHKIYLHVNRLQNYIVLQYKRKTLPPAASKDADHRTLAKFNEDDKRLLQLKKKL